MLCNPEKMIVVLLSTIFFKSNTLTPILWDASCQIFVLFGGVVATGVSFLFLAGVVDDIFRFRQWPVHYSMMEPKASDPRTAWTHSDCFSELDTPPHRSLHPLRIPAATSFPPPFSPSLPPLPHICRDRRCIPCNKSTIMFAHMYLEQTPVHKEASILSFRLSNPCLIFRSEMYEFSATDDRLEDERRAIYIRNPFTDMVLSELDIDTSVFGEIPVNEQVILSAMKQPQNLDLASDEDILKPVSWAQPHERPDIIQQLVEGAARLNDKARILNSLRKRISQVNAQNPFLGYIPQYLRPNRIEPPEQHQQQQEKQEQQRQQRRQQEREYSAWALKRFQLTPRLYAFGLQFLTLAYRMPRARCVILQQLVDKAADGHDRARVLSVFQQTLNENVAQNPFISHSPYDELLAHQDPRYTRHTCRRAGLQYGSPYMQAWMQARSARRAVHDGFLSQREAMRCRRVETLYDRISDWLSDKVNSKDATLSSSHCPQEAPPRSPLHLNFRSKIRIGIPHNMRSRMRQPLKCRYVNRTFLAALVDHPMNRKHRI